MALTLWGDFSDFEFAQKLAEEWNEGPQIDEIDLQKQHDQILTYALRSSSSLGIRCLTCA
jgi:hypothetical protein